MLGWVVLAILYCVYLADFIVTVAVIRGLNKKLTKLDKIRSDMRIISDKISDTLATTTIETAQAVGEKKVQVALARAELRDSAELKKDKSLEMLRKKKAELQKEFEELENILKVSNTSSLSFPNILAISKAFKLLFLLLLSNSIMLFSINIPLLSYFIIIYFI